MSINLSKQKRDKMLKTIAKIKENIDDDETLKNLSLIEYELTKKKYGLVWEEHEERVDEELKTQIPTFEEVTEKEIKLNNDEKFNFLLEGDNLHSLYILEKTHKGKIDFIYIDPPYNTGNKDFIYNDEYINNDDGYKHSKWLSFMNNRLKIAHNLLSDSGVIFISIDDNEQAQLKLLCDEIFGDHNCIGILPTIMNLKGNQDQFGFAGTHEYTLVYARDIFKCELGQFDIDEEEIEKEWLIDDIGYYKKGANLKSTGVNAPREKRPNLYFPIYVLDETPCGMKNENQKYRLEWSLEPKDGFLPIYPITNGKEMSWRWSKNKFKSEAYNVIITSDGKDGISFYKKQRPSIGEIPTKKPKSFFYKPEYSSGNGTNQIVRIFGSKVFNNPKPVDLIKDFIRIGLKNKKGVVLDFFAGSGTTAQAVLELNKEDNGKRNFILCTNNENKICENITYERIKTIITGKTKSNMRFSDGIISNLKYYRTAYVPRMNTEDENIQENLLVNIKNLIQLENGIDIDDRKIKVILDEKKIDEFSTKINEVKECEKLYISSDILLTAKQTKLFKNNNIEIFIIPEYYFDEEIKEVQ